MDWWRIFVVKFSACLLYEVGRQHLQFVDQHHAKQPTNFIHRPTVDVIYLITSITCLACAACSPQQTRKFCKPLLVLVCVLIIRVTLLASIIQPRRPMPLPDAEQKHVNETDTFQEFVSLIKQRICSNAYVWVLHELPGVCICAESPEEYDGIRDSNRSLLRKGSSFCLVPQSESMGIYGSSITCLFSLPSLDCIVLVEHSHLLDVLRPIDSASPSLTLLILFSLVSAAVVFSTSDRSRTYRYVVLVLSLTMLNVLLVADIPAGWYGTISWIYCSALAAGLIGRDRVTSFIIDIGAAVEWLLTSVLDCAYNDKNTKHMSQLSHVRRWLFYTCGPLFLTLIYLATLIFCIEVVEHPRDELSTHLLGACNRLCHSPLFILAVFLLIVAAARIVSCALHGFIGVEQNEDHENRICHATLTVVTLLNLHFNAATIMKSMVHLVPATATWLIAVSLKPSVSAVWEENTKASIKTHRAVLVYAVLTISPIIVGYALHHVYNNISMVLISMTPAFAICGGCYGRLLLIRSLFVTPGRMPDLRLNEPNIYAEGDLVLLNASISWRRWLATSILYSLLLHLIICIVNVHTASYVYVLVISEVKTFVETPSKRLGLYGIVLNAAWLVSTMLLMFMKGGRLESYDDRDDSILHALYVCIFIPALVFEDLANVTIAALFAHMAAATATVYVVARVLWVSHDIWTSAETEPVKKIKVLIVYCILFAAPLYVFAWLLATFNCPQLAFLSCTPALTLCGTVCRVLVRYPVFNWLGRRYHYGVFSVKEIARVVSLVVHVTVTFSIFLTVGSMDHMCVSFEFVFICSLNVIVAVVYLTVALCDASLALKRRRERAGILSSMTTVAQSDSPELCPICFAELNASYKSSVVLQTRCRHTFHQDCLSEWLDIQLTCPTCRRNVN